MKQALYLLIILALSTTYLSAQTEIEKAELLGQWSKDGLVGSSLYDNIYNEVWGVALNGREYAIMGSTAGTHFIDVTDPTDLEEVYFVEGRQQGSRIIHRDYHHYGCYLYAVADEGNSSLQIMDMSYLPDSVHMAYDSAEEIATTHNIYIDTAMATLYAFAASGGSTNYSALRVYDISEPVNPTYINSYRSFGDVFAGHVHDGHVENGLAFLNCGNDGFAMVDFTNPEDPVTLGTMTQYPFAGYNHSGWPTPDGQYYYLADETHGFPMKVIDISNPEELMSLNTIAGPPTAPMDSTITHNQIVACNYLYVSYYYDGLMVYDISDPVNPAAVRHYDTSTWPFDTNYRGAWGIFPFLPSGNILLTDMQEGLFVFAGPGDNCTAREGSVISCNTPVSTTPPLSPDQSWVAYPTISSGSLSLKTRNSTRIDARFSLFNIDGQQVANFGSLRIDQTGLSITLPLLPAGVYLLQSHGNNGVQIQKVIIQ